MKNGRPRKLTKKQVDKMVYLYTEERLSSLRIGRLPEFDLNHTTVLLYLKDRGVRIRGGYSGRTHVPYIKTALDELLYKPRKRKLSKKEKKHAHILYPKQREPKSYTDILEEKEITFNKLANAYIPPEGSV